MVSCEANDHTDAGESVVAGRTIRAQGKLDEPQNFFLKQYSTATDENGELFTDDRVVGRCK